MAGKDQYEIEIKSLLGGEQEAHDFRNKIAANYPGVGASLRETQVNHYFEGGDLAELARRMAPRLSADSQTKLENIVARATAVSIRTRKVEETVRFIVKASLGSDSSANGVARAELDVPVEDMTLDELDAEILAAGYQYQAKWSRRREAYELGDVTVCLDRNAGYGYLAEFEKVVDDESAISEAEAELRVMMRAFGAAELPQDRLERMFAHYNQHWPDYYGTDKVFIIE